MRSWVFLLWLVSKSGKLVHPRCIFNNSSDWLIFYSYLVVILKSHLDLLVSQVILSSPLFSKGHSVCFRRYNNITV